MHFNSKIHTIRHHTGEEFTFTSVRKFADKNKLGVTNMHHLVSGKRATYAGYTLVSSVKQKRKKKKKITADMKDRLFKLVMSV